MSDITPSVVSDIHSCIQVDVFRFFKRRGEFSTDRRSNAGDVHRLAVLGLNNLDEQRQLLSGIDGLRTDVRKSSALVQWIEI